MKRTYKILRGLAVTLIALVFILPATLYVALSLPAVQQYICHRAESELSNLLGVEVKIAHIHISPFNHVTLYGVDVADGMGGKAMTVDRLGAGVDLWSIAAHDRIVVNYAEILGMHANIYRADPDSPLNIQPIIDALSPKDKTKPPTRFDFRINTVVLRSSAVDYNVLSEPQKERGLDPNHLAVTALNADICLPRISNDNFEVELRRLALRERSGLKIDQLTANAHITNKMIDLSDFELSMPDSKLLLNNQHIEFDGFNNLKSALPSMPMDIQLLPGSHIATSDMVFIEPRLEGLDMTLQAHAHLVGRLDAMEIKSLELEGSDGTTIAAIGRVDGLPDINAMTFDFPNIAVKVNGSDIVNSMNRFASAADAKLQRLLTNAGNIELKASATGSTTEGDVDAQLTADQLDVMVKSTYALGSKKAVKGHLTVNRFDGGALLAGVQDEVAKLTQLEADVDYDIVLGQKLPQGTIDLDLHHAAYNGINLSDLTANVVADGDNYSAMIDVDNQALSLHADANAVIGAIKELRLNIDADNIDGSLFAGVKGLADKRLTLQCEADLYGTGIEDAAGTIDIPYVDLRTDDGRRLQLRDIAIAAWRNAEADSLTITSEIADAEICGKFNVASLGHAVKGIVARTVPALAPNINPSDPGYWTPAMNINDFTYRVVVKTLDPLNSFVKLPIGVIDRVKMFGDVCAREHALSITIDAPYLLQGNKLIEKTALQAGVRDYDTSGGRGNLYFTTTLPTKKGPMTLMAQADAVGNQMDTRLKWRVQRERNFSGDINTSARFSRCADDGNLRSEIIVNPSKMVFNDTIWTIDPSTISIEGKEIVVDNFRAWRTGQSIAMNGRVSDSEADTITLRLDDVNLDYVFETLDIPTAMFGGNASGVFYATELLTSHPNAYTPGLSVKNLSYNHSLMGDAQIRSAWVNATKAITLRADILQPNGRTTTIDGAIYPTADSLDLMFDADRVNVGFLLPYMSAFTTEISGYASGRARLWGTFKLIDMVGDIYGEDIKLRLGFTNTAYTTTDSVLLRPGRIDLNNLLLTDEYGHTARLNGWLKHKYFKEPEFNFRISDAHNLLVYDVKETGRERWFGRVFGNGSASVTGKPGIVDIGVNMATTTGSTFTFVLSDALDAQDYNFITFRDRNRHIKDSIAALDAPPPAVQLARQRMMATADGGAPSNYRLNFNIDITPQALITLVMDPVGGDRIRAYGSGNLRMTYDGADEDLRMNGTYTVNRGTYNFTLQDIILKEFTINDGSSITFHGDPYSAQLDIRATYQVKANLTDLDESFQEDKELNRTNVPVDAVLLVTGDMRQPEIGFDLEFPTLTQETKRKVRSIVNTDDMMNRQIIYLLALNRFYTPDYMNATRGNELVSVASSTISSQLSNILGQLSDNWNIAPNFRSDRGDFSDVEVDVALSSHLLNNRLLFNGNFGYRDKSLNNNSFIGDFDIEYLLNRSGSFRLKAYNRYNDQNYYLKSALTTQGVGIVFKRDFDNILSFLRPWRRKATPATTPTPTDSIAPTPTLVDSIP